MRAAFIKALSELAEKDKDVFLITGDLGFPTFNAFKEKFPDRFINAGVAEQNMIGVAVGLSLTGKKVYVYSIIPFITMRCFEQIRNDISYQKANVKLIGVGSGFCYGPAGISHHSTEDISIMRALPNMTVVCPGGSIETERAVKAANDFYGPIYLRLGRKGEADPTNTDAKFSMGKGMILHEGKQITLITCGDILEVCQKVVEELEKDKFSVRLINMHTIKPIDKELIIDSILNTKYIFSVEEHNIVGGLGSSVAEVVSESNLEKKVYFCRIGIEDKHINFSGSRDYLRAKTGINKEEICKRIKNFINDIESKSPQKTFLNSGKTI